MNDISLLGQTLGEQLKQLRITKGDRQTDMAARIGISITTYQRMEAGDTTVSLKHWLQALLLLGRGPRIESLFAAEEDLFGELDSLLAKTGTSQRKRVRRGR